MAKKRVGVSGWKVTKKNIRGEEFLPKPTKEFLRGWWGMRHLVIYEW